jgi:hypothetical protein
MTCRPRDPLVMANGSKPSDSSSSRSDSAPARMDSKSSPFAGSRSKTRRSGRSGRSARLAQTCGVMQFWFASHTSVAASPPTAWTTVPPLRRSTPTRRTQSGAPRGISCWTTRSPWMPLFQRHRFSGRSRTCGAIAGATAA